jgi:Adaptin N terminal region
MSHVVASVVTSGDPASLLNAQLASALSTMGDAQYWEENISPNTIRTELSTSDPSNPNSTPALLKGMKWLLASISKGRDVSDFYPHVVKMVGASSLEVRKMVYMYLVQYADKDPTTRELSLLSINSFQRGLADSEQLIRALALRVLTSIRIPDILQIQILGVQKCSKDNSPYVRKCAANALAKLSPRCVQVQVEDDNTDDLQEMLLEIMKSLLDHDSSTMVLTSTVIAFTELCPERLELLHSCFRKLCHLLTDMDEWGQVAVIDTLQRYCRKFFREPRAWREGTAERIDRARRVRRTLSGIVNEVTTSTTTTTLEFVETTDTDAVVGQGLDAIVTLEKKSKKEKHKNKETTTTTTHDKLLPPHPNRSDATKKIKRRVVKKGFYSDEEDESTEEEMYDQAGNLRQQQRNVMGMGVSSAAMGGIPVAAINEDAEEDEELDPDHRLLLRSAMPLLKSRNSGVVLAVCSLQYYCGVSSIKVRSSIGKALVRIHRDRREIQYVVLTSIRTMVHECPSAFAPFLQDFFVMVSASGDVELHLFFFKSRHA